MKKAIVIGLNYRGTEYELPGCENDANDLSAILAGQKVAVRKYATIGKRELTDLLSEARNMKSRDTLILCYSGHGTQVNSKGEPDGISEALVLHDGETPEILFDAELKDLLAKIPCKKLIYFDSCFAGGMSRAAKVKGLKRRYVPFSLLGIASPVRMKMQRAMVLGKVCWIFASAEGEVAIDLGTNGAFTDAFLAIYTLGIKTVASNVKACKALIREYQTPEYDMGGQKTVKLF